MTNKTDTPPGYPPRVDRKMADDEAQRIARLEQRALEAEESIRLMKNFIELLSHGAGKIDRLRLSTQLYIC